MKYPAKWEEIIPNQTYRMKVPGGWLVSDIHQAAEGTYVGLGSFFFPDPDYLWELE